MGAAAVTVTVSVAVVPAKLAVMVAVQSFVGLVDEVGSDLLALRGAFGRVEIHVGAGIPISFELVEHATHGGTRAAARRDFRDDPQ